MIAPVSSASPWAEMQVPTVMSSALPSSVAVKVVASSTRDRHVVHGEARVVEGGDLAGDDGAAATGSAGASAVRLVAGPVAGLVAGGTRRRLPACTPTRATHARSRLARAVDGVGDPDRGRSGGPRVAVGGPSTDHDDAAPDGDLLEAARRLGRDGRRAGQRDGDLTLGGALHLEDVALHGGDLTAGAREAATTAAGAVRSRAG